MTINQSLHDAGDLRRWYAQIPNLVYDLGLSPNAGWLYGHYKRVCGANGGSCEEGSRKTAEKCCMSVGSVSSAKRELFLAGLIDVYVSRRGNRTYHRIEVVDIWEQNFKRYSKDAMVSIDDIKNAIKRNSAVDYFTDSSSFTPVVNRSIVEPKPETRSIVEHVDTIHRSAGEAALGSTIEHKNNKIEGTVEDSENIIDSQNDENGLPLIPPYDRDWEPPVHPSAAQSAQPGKMTYKDSWLATKGQLELQLNRATYDTWIVDTKFYSVGEDTLTLYTRNHYAQDIVANRFGQSIMHTYAGISQSAICQLKVITHGHPAIITRRDTTGRYAAPIPARSATLNQAAIAI